MTEEVTPLFPIRNQFSIPPAADSAAPGIREGGSGVSKTGPADATLLSGELADELAGVHFDPEAGARSSFLLASSAIWDLLKRIAPREGLEEQVLIKMLTFIMKLSSTYTFEHSWRVNQYSRELAAAYGLGAEEEEAVADAALFRDLGLEDFNLSRLPEESRERVTSYLRQMDSTLRACATLHDVGKIQIPLEILHKPTSLTDEEYEIVKRHPIIGEELLRRIPSLLPAAPGVRHHHEHWDGDGYPDGIAGVEIPLAARIVAITDAFDAMISERPYKPAYPLEQALVELEAHAGSQFDPGLVRLFIKLRQTHGIEPLILETPGELS